jgi:hypothetical protein
MLFRIERSATFVLIDKALQQKISGYDALFTALMRKSILRATSHFRYLTGCWEIFHNSVNFGLIFEIFSPRSSEIKDLQLLCRLTTLYSRKFRDRMLCLQHSIYGMRPIQNFPIFVFNLTLNLDFMVTFFNVITCPFSKTIFLATNRI